MTTEAEQLAAFQSFQALIAAMNTEPLPVPPPPAPVPTFPPGPVVVAGFKTSEGISQAVGSLVAAGLALFTSIHPGHLNSTAQASIVGLSLSIVGLIQIVYTHARTQVHVAAINNTPTPIPTTPPLA